MSGSITFREPNALLDRIEAEIEATEDMVAPRNARLRELVVRHRDEAAAELKTLVKDYQRALEAETLREGGQFTCCMVGHGVTPCSKELRERAAALGVTS